MLLQHRNGEALEPTQIVGQCPFPRATLVLTKIDIEDPVHGLDAPMPANRLAESFPAEVFARDVVAGADSAFVGISRGLKLV